MDNFIYHFMYIIIYIDFTGTVIFATTLFWQCVSKTSNKLQVYLVALFFFSVPIYSPKLKLIDPESNWIPEYKKAAIVWCIMAMILYLYRIIVKIYIKNRFKNNDMGIYYIEDVLKISCMKLSIKNIPQIVYSEKVDIAAVMGVVKPKLLFNEKICTNIKEEELELVFMHELMHLKRRHLLIQSITYIVCCIHWFNPLVWYLRKKITLTCELDCDRKLVKRNFCKASRYARLLIHLAESVNSQKNLFGALKLNNYKLLKMRILTLFEKKSEYIKVKIVILIGVIAILVFFFMKKSESYFYPYPANINDIEMREEYEQI